MKERGEVVQVVPESGVSVYSEWSFPWASLLPLAWAAWLFACRYQLCSTEHVPAPPPGASEECIDFLQRCFQRDPGARDTAAQLLQHPFVGLGVDDSDPS